MVSNQMLLCRDCGRRFNPPDLPSEVKGGKDDAPMFKPACRYCGSTLVLIDDR